MCCPNFQLLVFSFLKQFEELDEYNRYSLKCTCYIGHVLQTVHGSNMFFFALYKLADISAAICFRFVVVRFSDVMSTCQSKFKLSALKFSPICTGHCTILHCVGLIDMYKANQNTEIFVCVSIITRETNPKGIYHYSGARFKCRPSALFQHASVR